jgi:serine/threonine-protein kinase
LINSYHNAFLGTYDRRASETVLLRADEVAMAQGTVFWQGSGDAVEVEAFTAVGDAPPPSRPRDVVLHWVNFWGSNHQREITGPHAGTNLRSVRLLDLPRPGRVEPADLILDPDYHPFRPRLDVGADLFSLGITPKTFSTGRRR